MQLVASAADPKEAIRQHRARLGTLQQLQVAPGTQKRYMDALCRLWQWMQAEEHTIPDKVCDLDAIVSDYIEHLWCEGDGLSLAKDTLSALQWGEPNYKQPTTVVDAMQHLEPHANASSCAAASSPGAFCDGRA